MYDSPPRIRMKRLTLALVASIGCASAPVASVSVPDTAPVASVRGPLLSGPALWADSAARQIEKATIRGDLEGLRSAKLLLDRALAAYPNDPLLLHYQGYELYREAGLLDGRGAAAQAEVPLVTATARTKLEQSLAGQPLPETHALLAMVMGRMIGGDPSFGPTLGPLIPQEIRAAVTTGPNNPRVWLLRGIQSYYTPIQYGGGLLEAETQLNKAIELFATDHPVPPAPSWGKAEAFVWLGKVFQKQSRIEEARAAYKDALGIQPDYPWVTYSLLPSLPNASK